MEELLEQTHSFGYRIEIAFVFLDSADACVARVAERVRRGGHDVPEDDVRRRFTRSLRNFWTTYREIADLWSMLYNVGSGYVEVASASETSLPFPTSCSFIAFSKLPVLTKMANTTIPLEIYEKVQELVRLGNRAAHDAQEENRRLGIPNVYSINGILYWELPDGTLSRTDPYKQ